jgi:hypothetical protein
MAEMKSAKLLAEVQWGIIPGTVDGNKQWGWSREEVEAALDALTEDDTEKWRGLLHEAYAEFDRRSNPNAHNWVTLTWLWL